MKKLLLLLLIFLWACEPTTDAIQTAIVQTQSADFNAQQATKQSDLAKYADCLSNFIGIVQNARPYYGKNICIVGLIAYENSRTDPNTGATLYIAHFSLMSPGLELISVDYDVFSSLGNCVSANGMLFPDNNSDPVNPAIYVYTAGDPNLAKIYEAPQDVCVRSVP